MGLNLTLAASMAASKGVLPSLCFKVANSTIKMAFLPNSPISMIIAICAYILFSNPNKYKNKNAPTVPAGRDKITGIGSKKLSYCAESNK